MILIPFIKHDYSKCNINLFLDVKYRQWMLVRANGDFLSQRHYSKMALVRVSNHHDNIHLDAPGQPTLVLPKNPPVDQSRFMMTR